MEHSIARLLFGNVRVAADHNRESGGFGLEVQRCQIVQHIDGDASDFEDFIFGQPLCPPLLVDVAANGGHGRNCGELRDDSGCPEIPGMNDVIRPAQSLDCLGTQQSVCI
jgi:hypothetical protein